MGSPRSEASTPPSSLQSVLLDHSYGKAAGVKEFSMVIKVEREGGEESDEKDKEENQKYFDNEEQIREDPVVVYLKEPKVEAFEETLCVEEIMLQDHKSSHLKLMQKELKYPCEEKHCAAKFTTKEHLESRLYAKGGLWLRLFGIMA